jgi:hypothetical protein
MYVQVYIPTVILEVIEETFDDLYGRKPTTKELRDFLAADVATLYDQGIHDAPASELESSLHHFFYHTFNTPPEAA